MIGKSGWPRTLERAAVWPSINETIIFGEYYVSCTKMQRNGVDVKNLLLSLCSFLLLFSIAIDAHAKDPFTGDQILFMVTDRAVEVLKGELSVSEIEHWHSAVRSRVNKLRDRQSNFRGKPIRAWAEADEFATVLREMLSLAREVVGIQDKIRKLEEDVDWKPELKPEIDRLNELRQPKVDKLFSLRASLAPLRDTIREKGIF